MHIDAVRRLFEEPNFQKTLMSVAFVTEDGVDHNQLGLYR
jgi:hypothetical protein